MYFFIMLAFNFVIFGLLNGFILRTFLMSLIVSFIGGFLYIIFDYFKI